MSKIHVQPSFHKRKDDIPESAGYSVASLVEDSASGKLLGEIANLSIPVGLFVAKPKTKKNNSDRENIMLHNASTVIDEKIHNMLKNKIILSSSSSGKSKSKRQTRKKRSLTKPTTKVNTSRKSNK